jgi:signal peptidase I
MKDTLKKIWYFIWESDSIWSWIVNVILAFLLIYFIVYPGLGFIFQTTHPIVAVVSGSMEHDGNIDQWWDSQGEWYEENTDITKEQFQEFKYKNGFNKGDIMVLKGVSPENVQVGDVLVFNGRLRDPIIHRIVNINEENNVYSFTTKGDHNSDADTPDVKQEETVGYQKYQKSSKAILRIPYLGYIKLAFVAQPVIFIIALILFVAGMSYHEEIKKLIIRK